MPFLFHVEAGGTITATGGDITTFELEGTTYKVHRFTSNSTFEVTEVTGSPMLDYLIIGGGGGGGYAQATGGAAGWLVSGQLTPTAQSYGIVVGSAGGGGTSGHTAGYTGNQSAFGNLTADGGLGGMTNQVTAPSGNNHIGGTRYQPSPANVACGGAAGAGGDGGNASSSGGGAGGAGILSSITGSPLYYAGGGGGGTYTNNAWPGGVGGSGVGGNGGGCNPLVNPTAGASYTGSGGGGGCQYGSIRSGAAGGSGVVIIKYSI